MMKLVLKNIILNLSQSLSSHCFTATLWIDGSPSFSVKDEGFAEPMLYERLPSATIELSSLIQHLSPQATDAEPTAHYQFLDDAITAMVDEYILQKKTALQLRYVSFFHGKRLYELNKALASDELAIARLKKSHWWHSDNIILNELPVSEAAALLKQYHFRVLPFDAENENEPFS